MTIYFRDFFPSALFVSDFGLDGKTRGGNIDHLGVDIFAPVGTPVLAFEKGTVIRADNRDAGGYGNVVFIAHKQCYGRDFVTVYSHLSSMNVRVPNSVSAGQVVGYSGRTGNAGDVPYPHLHFGMAIKANLPRNWESGKTLVKISRADFVDPYIQYKELLAARVALRQQTVTKLQELRNAIESRKQKLIQDHQNKSVKHIEEIFGAQSLEAQLNMYALEISMLDFKIKSVSDGISFDNKELTIALP